MDQENHFYEFLKYQIGQKKEFNGNVRKIPLFKNKTQDHYFTILKMTDIHRRDIYSLLMKNVEDIIVLQH
jgi:hypothetical protein